MEYEEVRGKRREDEAARRDKSNYPWSHPESARRVIMDRHRKLRKMGMKKLQQEGARRDSLPPENGADGLGRESVARK